MDLLIELAAVGALILAVMALRALVRRLIGIPGPDRTYRIARRNGYEHGYDRGYQAGLAAAKTQVDRLSARIQLAAMAGAICRRRRAKLETQALRAALRVRYERIAALPLPHEADFKGTVFGCVQNVWRGYDSFDLWLWHGGILPLLEKIRRRTEAMEAEMIVWRLERANERLKHVLKTGQYLRERKDSPHEGSD